MTSWVSTVGPFLFRGEPAVRAASEAGAAYLDAAGEPPFLRRVFEELGPVDAFGPAALQAGAAAAGLERVDA